MKVKIRGIFSTALSKFLLNNDFEIAEPTRLVAERLDIGQNEKSADILIYDKEDKNGVTINGKDCDEIINLLKDEFEDVSVKKMETGAIYCGKIEEVDRDNKKVIVDLGEEEDGILDLEEYWGFLREGEEVLVQVKNKVRGKILLSTKLRLFGNDLVLIEDGFTKVSKHIKNPTEKERLLSIGKDMDLEDWGILWKALAEGKDKEMLRDEIQSLLDKEDEVKEKFEEKEEPGLIEQGLQMYFVDFGLLSKQKLDDVRSEATETVKGHHFLKGGGYSLLVDFAESLRGEADIDSKLIVEKINKALKEDGPTEGNLYEVKHKKLNSKDITIKGVVEDVEENKIVLRRKLKSGGKLDGIGKDIEEGDYAITKLVSNEWFIKHKYFDENDNLKGKYISVNTPVEIYPEFARYMDLEIDVVEEGGKRKIVDEDDLKEKFEENIISKELMEKAQEVANDNLKE